MLDAEKLSTIDSALRLLDREVWIVTAADGHRRGGLLATWVSPASIDRQRPVLLAALAPNHFTTELVLSSKAFGAHLLRPDQIDRAWNLASGSGRSRDKLGGLETKRRATGSPILADCIAWFDCQIFAQFDAGDRMFFWGEVVDGDLHLKPGSETASLASCLREQEFFSRLTADQRQLLAADRDADASRNGPLFERFRAAQTAG